MHVDCSIWQIHCRQANDSGDYMARSQTSPRMRDQRRAGDHHREDSSGAAKIGSAATRTSKGELSLDTGVKIKGRASGEASHLTSHRHTAGRDQEPSTRAARKSSRSPRRHRRREGSFDYRRELSEDRHRDYSYHYKSRRRSPVARRRSPTGSIDREPIRSREHRGRSPSPFRPQHRYRAGGGQRRQEYSVSPTPRADYYVPQREDAQSLAGDSYIPSGRGRRSRSRAVKDFRDKNSRKRSYSPRPSDARFENHTQWEDDPRHRHVPRDKPYHRNHSFSRDPSRDRYPRSSRTRRRSRSWSREISNRHSKKPRLSRSPVGRKGASGGSEMQSTHRIQVLDSSSRQPSPPRPIPSFDSDSQNSTAVKDVYPLHGKRASDMHGPGRAVRPQINTQHSYSASPQWTPVSSQHGSPQSASSYGHGRGGWAAHDQQYHGQPRHVSDPYVDVALTGFSQSANAYSPPYRQNSYPQNSPHGQYYPSNQQAPYGGPPQQMQPGYQTPSFRGGHSGYRGNHYSQPPDRRFSGSGPPTYGPGPQAVRGRGGHFQNLQWTANGGSRGGQTNQSQHNAHQPAQTHNSQRLQNAHSSEQSTASAEDEDNPFRPSKDLQVEDQSIKDTFTQNGSRMAPPSRQSSGAFEGKESSKFSFIFKGKPAPGPATKPVPDLTQKMKDPPRKENLLDHPKAKPATSPALPESAYRSREDVRHDGRFDRRDERREREHREGYRSRNDRYERDYHDDRRASHRDGYRDERRQDKEYLRQRERERSPEPEKVKKIMKRLKPRATLPPELAESTSVYYRKPGNESVVGSGTYGKVFKAIHVYTKNLVALKKIRMEGEKDGFPVTAIREIKLLQSLKHDNIVCLQEVMVEHNDCFMVFEYLSHDLTGLLNHPTFKLEHAHKKHLARQLFEGLNHLHRRGVLHRDIKAANILISNDGLLKLADFGLARFYSKSGHPDYTNRVITIWYRSPELLLGETQYGPAVDIWSAACVMIEIFTRHAVFPGDGGEINQLDKIYNVLGTPTRSEWPGLVDMAWFELLRPAERKPNTFAEKYQERVTPHAFELLQNMFLYDPVKRPTASDVLEHPYFTTEEPAPRQAVE